MKMLPISLLFDDIIDNVLLPFIPAEDLHYLKLTNSKWKQRIESFIIRSAPKIQFKDKLSYIGNNLEKFNCPYFVACDNRNTSKSKQQNHIFVSDCGSHRIQVFYGSSSDIGKWKLSIGSYGSGHGQFDDPMGVALNSKNHLIVADWGNHRVQVFDEELRFLMSFGSKGFKNGEFMCLRGIAVDAQDNIIVADCGNHRIQVFDCNGVWKQSIGREGYNNGEFCDPWGVAVCKANGRIYVSDCYNYCIQVFSASGRFLFKFGPKGIENGQFISPRDLVLSNNGQYLLVCDLYNHRIQIFNAMNGEFIKCCGSKGLSAEHFLAPCGICVSPSGLIIVSEAESRRVRIFE